MNHHYYFKFQKQNAGLKNAIEKGDTDNLPLSIYYGTWKVSQFKSILSEKGLSPIKKSQIDEFFKIGQQKTKPYFWIFHEMKIYCYKAISNKIFNASKEWISPSGGLPKAIQCKLVKIFEKIDLPECFANINSNQRYNRRTITKLTDQDTELAEALIKTAKIKISKENFLNYLSPIEFETICFMIFNSGKSFCSSFRGGTLAGVDLRVITHNEFQGFPKKLSIQVKKK